MSIAAEPEQILLVNETGGLAIGEVVTTGWRSVRGMQGGSLRGNAHQDVAGTLTVEFSLNGTDVDDSWDVTRDTDQADFQYPFSIAIFQPFVRVSFTNGGAPSTFFRANAAVLPV